MESFSVSTVLGEDDWRALNRASRLRAWSPESKTLRLLIRAPFFLLLALTLAGIVWAHTDRELLALCGGILATFLLVAAQSFFVQKLAKPKQTGLFFGPTRYLFGAEGVEVERPDSGGHARWNQFVAIESTRTHVLLWLTQSSGYVVPGRDLTGGLSTDMVAARLRAFSEQSKAGVAANDIAQPDFSVPPPAPESLPIRPTVSLAQELAAAAKQLLLLRANPERLVGSDGAIATLVLIALALWLPLDWFVYEGPMAFMPDQLGGLAFVAVGFLALAWIVARLSVPRVEYRRVLLVVAASAFLAIAASTLFNLLAEHWMASTALLLAMTAYAMLYYKFSMRTLTGFVQTRALLVGALATFLFIGAMDRLYINPTLWVYTGDDDADLEGGTNYQDAWRRIADVQFAQQARIDAEIAKIAAKSAEGTQAYFVGFAGYGEQRVFAREIELAAQRIGERYRADGREILLVNDRRDLEKYPLATARALEYTLESLGKVMDENDILFLSLSSHGDDDATLSVSNAGMMPGELDVTQIADALKASRIRWKVIVISACYAGSFIDQLADEHTIVITAAAADRTSFGCADDRDLTYFGEAFYRDAMPKTHTLRAAFDAAKASIAEREKAEGVEASNPQAYFGAAIEPWIDRVDGPPPG